MNALVNTAVTRVTGIVDIDLFKIYLAGDGYSTIQEDYQTGSVWIKFYAGDLEELKQFANEYVLGQRLLKFVTQSQHNALAEYSIDKCYHPIMITPHGMKFWAVSKRTGLPDYIVVGKMGKIYNMKKEQVN